MASTQIYTKSNSFPAPSVPSVIKKEETESILRKLLLWAGEHARRVDQEFSAIQSSVTGNISIAKTASSGGSSGSSAGGGGGLSQAYVTVQNQGTPLIQRSTLNFIGDAVVASDDSINKITDVTVTTTSEVTLTMNASVSAFQAVTSNGFVADSSNTAYVSRVLGLAQAAITSGFSGPIQTSGEIVNPAWSWTAGDTIYLNSTSLSTTAPSTGFVVQIGKAKTNNTIEINIGLSILL